jgi:hypothetical protein
MLQKKHIYFRREHVQQRPMHISSEDRLEDVPALDTRKRQGGAGAARRGCGQERERQPGG